MKKSEQIPTAQNIIFAVLFAIAFTFLALRCIGVIGVYKKAKLVSIESEELAHDLDVGDDRGTKTYYNDVYYGIYQIKNSDESYSVCRTEDNCEFPENATIVIFPKIWPWATYDGCIYAQIPFFCDRMFMTLFIILSIFASLIWMGLIYQYLIPKRKN